MARVILATIGSLGDLHPKIALGLELKRRGHDVAIATWRGYREKIENLDLDFFPIRPDADQNDTELYRRVMDAASGPEYVIRDLIVANVRDTFADLMPAMDAADALVTGEIVYPAASVAELTGAKWISTSLAPVSFFSAHDPSVYVRSGLLESLRQLPTFFHRGMLAFMRGYTRRWLAEYRAFRRELGLSEYHDPMMHGKFSPLLHLAMFSRVLGVPQPDWPANAVQTGFCFYDADGFDEIDPALQRFLDAGKPPIVFTLGSAAVMDPRDFFEQSAEAARALGRRAVLLYGRDQPAPAGIDGENVVGFEYAPFSQIFPKAACVVHQGGAGTTGQVLRAGVPHVVVPFSHDQPDNAARCRRLGVALEVARNAYTAESAARALSKILTNPSFAENARRVGETVRSEGGTAQACDSIESELARP